MCLLDEEGELVSVGVAICRVTLDEPNGNCDKTQYSPVSECQCRRNVGTAEAYRYGVFRLRTAEVAAAPPSAPANGKFQVGLNVN